VQTLRFGVDPYGLFESAHRAFGDVFTLRVMAETWVILAHPEAVRDLYRHGPDELDSGVANMSLRPLLGTHNVLLLDGGEHLRRRKLVLPPLHGERMFAYEELIREATRRVVADVGKQRALPDARLATKNERAACASARLPRKRVDRRELRCTTHQHLPTLRAWSPPMEMFSSERGQAP